MRMPDDKVLQEAEGDPLSVADLLIAGEHAAIGLPFLGTDPPVRPVEGREAVPEVPGEVLVQAGDRSAPLDLRTGRWEAVPGRWGGRGLLGRGLCAFALPSRRGGVLVVPEDIINVHLPWAPPSPSRCHILLRGGQLRRFRFIPETVPVLLDLAALVVGYLAAVPLGEVRFRDDGDTGCHVLFPAGRKEGCDKEYRDQHNGRESECKELFLS